MKRYNKMGICVVLYALWWSFVPFNPDTSILQIYFQFVSTDLNTFWIWVFNESLEWLIHIGCEFGIFISHDEYLKFPDHIFNIYICKNAVLQFYKYTCFRDTLAIYIDLGTLG